MRRSARLFFHEEEKKKKVGKFFRVMSPGNWKFVLASFSEL